MSGNGNHDAKYAGLTHGSHRMLPAAVSIRMLAWPVPVTRTADPLVTQDSTKVYGRTLPERRPHPCPTPVSAARPPRCAPARPARPPPASPQAPARPVRHGTGGPSVGGTGRARLNGDLIEREGPKVAGSEPVTSPDQRKPRNPKPARIGAIVSAALLLLMMFGNHEGRVEDLWLMGLAALPVDHRDR